MAVNTEAVKAIRNPDYMTRAEFISRMVKIVGPDIPLWWLPTVSETTTSTDVGAPAGSGKTLTYSKDVTTWDTSIKYRGEGVAIKFDGTDEELDAADSADLSNTLDAMTWLAITNFTDATSSTIIGRMDLTTASEVREWLFMADSADKLTMEIWDESVPARIGQTSVDTLTEDEWAMYAATYDGGTASSGVNLYKNGVLINSDADETGTLVSGENLATVTSIGDYEGTGGTNVDFFDGSMAMVMVVAAELSAAQLFEAKTLCNSYLNLGM